MRPAASHGSKIRRRPRPQSEAELFLEKTIAIIYIPYARGV